jgi:hypothetical protein
MKELEENVVSRFSTDPDISTKADFQMEQSGRQEEFVKLHGDGFAHLRVEYPTLWLDKLHEALVKDKSPIIPVRRIVPKRRIP